MIPTPLKQSHKVKCGDQNELSTISEVIKKFKSIMTIRKLFQHKIVFQNSFF